MFYARTYAKSEIKREATNWPDYVFEKGYDLMSLEEVKVHIDQKGHLPGLRAAKDYESGGVNIMELNQKLLEKIEELTLHAITQEVVIKEQQSKMDDLTDESEKYAQEIMEIKATLEKILYEE